MRLLRRRSDGKFVLTDNLKDESVPPYAILSHTWGAEADEVTFDDLEYGHDVKTKPGHAKLQFCADRVMKDGLKHFWIDTCCINKSIRAEHSSAIQSMFHWYSRAARCYVYLSDVSVSLGKQSYAVDKGSEQPPDRLNDQRMGQVIDETPGAELQEFAGLCLWESDFRNSKWFTRG